MTEIPKKLLYLESIIFNPSSRVELGPIVNKHTAFVPGLGLINYDGNLRLLEFNNYLYEHGAISAHTPDGSNISHLAFDAEDKKGGKFRLIVDIQAQTTEWYSSMYHFPFSSLNPILVPDLQLAAAVQTGENDFMYSEISFLLHKIGNTLKESGINGLDEILELLGEGKPCGSDLPKDEHGLRFDPRLLE